MANFLNTWFFQIKIIYIYFNTHKEEEWQETRNKRLVEAPVTCHALFLLHRSLYYHTPLLHTSMHVQIVCTSDFKNVAGKCLFSCAIFGSESPPSDFKCYNYGLLLVIVIHFSSFRFFHSRLSPPFISLRYQQKHFRIMSDYACSVMVSSWTQVIISSSWFD